MLMHRLQAENALRRGLISDKRYADTLKRLSKGDTERTDLGLKFQSWLAAGGGFQRLELDPLQTNVNSSSSYVPEGTDRWFKNWLLETTDMCYEYHQAFYGACSLDLTVKYSRARIWITLASIVRSRGDGWDAERMRRAVSELIMIGEIGTVSKEGGLKDHARDLADFLLFLTYNAAELRDRLILLDGFAVVDFRNGVRADLFPPCEKVSGAISSALLPVSSNAISLFPYDEDELVVPESAGMCSGTLMESSLLRLIPQSTYYLEAKANLIELQSLSISGHWPKKLVPKVNGVTYYYEHMKDLHDEMWAVSELRDDQECANGLTRLIDEAIRRNVPLEAAGGWQDGTGKERHEIFSAGTRAKWSR